MVLNYARSEEQLKENYRDLEEVVLAQVAFFRSTL